MELPSPGVFVAGLVIATVAALVVFRHAERTGSRHATAWGIAAFLLPGGVVPVYFLRYWLLRRR